MGSLDSSTLTQKTIKELYEIAKEMSIPSYNKLRKQELVSRIVDEQNTNNNHQERVIQERVIQERVPQERAPQERIPQKRIPQKRMPQKHISQERNKQEYVSQEGNPQEGNSQKKPLNIKGNKDNRHPRLSREREHRKEYRRDRDHDRDNDRDRDRNMRTGVLEVLPEGYGFLRVNGYLPSTGDIYISQTQIKRFRLKTGHVICGQARPAKDGEKYFSLIKIDSVNGQEPDKIMNLKSFDNLTPIYPLEHVNLEHPNGDLSTRIMDMFCPVGKGQRGLIVSPPKAGKTTLLKAIAKSVEENHPEIILIALLIDERPEEVTDFQRSIQGEVVASTFDKLPEHHTRITEMVLEKAKRHVEMGKDVIILVDSITRMSRAYNLIIPPSGRTLSGGLDPNAMHSPKRFFGAARNMEFGGSLTILATALVETGSRMDDVIFEEFKGTGNMELRLDRKLSERRMFPAIDIKLSGTRKEELLLETEMLRKQHLLRRMLANADTIEATEFILDRLRKSKTNDEFLKSIVDSGIEL